MPATIDHVEIIATPDNDPDTSYLEQDEWEDRLAAYNAGDFSFCGVYLEATLRIPNGSGWITQEIRTPGLWGIETDSQESYLREVADDELDTLCAMLTELGVDASVVPMPEDITYR